MSMKADALRKANSELRKTITANRMAAGYSQYDDGSSQTSANFSSSDPEMKSASLGGPDAEVAAHGHKKKHTPLTDVLALKDLILHQWYINILLLIIPFAIASEHVGWGHTAVFVLNFIAVIPLANLLGIATEELALRTGEALGGLLNATFGNAVELILTISALSKGMISIVQGQLVGSILSNLLLVLGLCFLVGGIKNRPEQSFNPLGASTFSALLLLSCIGMVIPAVFQDILPPEEANQLYPATEVLLSRITAIILALMYVQYLVFQLFTHADQFAGESAEGEHVEEPMLSTVGAVVVLIGVTCLVALCSEYLTGALDSMSGAMSEAFIGIILLPLVGNAAEHLTAVTSATKNKMDLAIGVAVGSSAQIAMFVVPVVTLVGWIMDQPMNLNFRLFDTTILVLTVLIVTLIIQDGKSNWLEGSMLISVYAIVAVACWFNPETMPGGESAPAEAHH